MQYPEFLETLPEEDDEETGQPLDGYTPMQEDTQNEFAPPQLDQDEDPIDEPYVPPQANDDNMSVSSYAGSELTPEQEMQKKKKLLVQLRRMQKKGYTLSRHFTMESDLIEMQAEVESIKREANLGMVLKTLKRGLCVGTFLIEQVNNKYKPLGGAHLDGWSNQVKNDVEDQAYDEILEELYDKYADRLSMPPELKLLTMLGTSALQYHIAQSIISRTLSTHRQDEIIRNNPALRDQILQAAAREAESAQQTMDNPADFNDILEELEAEDEKDDE